jgi:hypothetical protein
LRNHIYRLNDGSETEAYLFVLGLLFAIPVVLTKRLGLPMLPVIVAKKTTKGDNGKCIAVIDFLLPILSQKFLMLKLHFFNICINICQIEANRHLLRDNVI